jgi:hypothetical protein
MRSNLVTSQMGRSSGNLSAATAPHNTAFATPRGGDSLCGCR